MIKMKSISELPVLQITNQVSFLLTYQVYRTEYVREVKVGAWNKRISPVTYGWDKQDKLRLSNYKVSGQFTMWVLLVFDSILSWMC